jgi:hypothetical protein
MKPYLLLLFFLLTTLTASSQTEFVKPWLDTSRPIIIDVYEGNAYDIRNVKKDIRIKGIIHKMSEESEVSFNKRRKEAYDNGLLFGSYWLPKYDSNGTKQADQYLKMIGDSAWTKEFMALDFEAHKKTKQFISAYNSYLFVKRIFEKTGRYPHIYCGLNNIDKLTNSEYWETFKLCKLWLIALPADGSVTNVFSKSTMWPTYSLWQFSCEINCCTGATKPCHYKAEGIDCYMDYDVYNGTYEELIQNWRK